VGAYQELAARIDTLVSTINRDHVAANGRVAVHYVAENLPTEDMLALFVAADVMVVNALRDGMNLVAKEFVACKNDNTGVLILSTTTGASDHMQEAVLVDPTDLVDLANVMVEARDMDKAEAQSRMAALRAYLHTHDVARWSREFLETLEASPRVGHPDQ
jgi:trehalose 6-phosphate synthase/phosphatase